MKTSDDAIKVSVWYLHDGAREDFYADSSYDIYEGLLVWSFEGKTISIPARAIRKVEEGC